MPIDGNDLLKKLWDGIIEFLTKIVETKTPNDIELAVWVWILIISLISGIFAGIFVWLKKR
jgi:hypothetical protein